MKKVTKNQDGFTLVEIICAIALLGILAVPTYNIFVGSANSQNKSKILQKANNVAQSIMEDTLADDKITVGSKDYTYDDFLVNVNIEKSKDLENSLNSGSNTLTIPGGATAAPSEPSDDPVINDGEPDDYNARIEVFDYADTDFYFMARAGYALLFNNKVNIQDKLNEFTKSGTYDYNSFFASSNLKTYTDMEDFTESDIKNFKAAANLTDHQYERALACFGGLPQSEVLSFMKTIMDRYVTVYNNTKSGLAGGSDTSAEEKINYILNSSNIFDTIENLYNTLYKGDTSEKAFFENLKPEWYATNLKSYMISNLYNSMYTKTTNATTNGPILRLKLFDVNGNIVSIGGKNVLTWYPPTGGSYGADINFQVWQDMIGFENWGLSYRWSDSYNPLNIETTSVSQNGWSYNNIYSDMTFYITGTLEYRSVRFAMLAGNPYASKEYDEATGKWNNYTANMNFFQKISSGSDKFTVEKYGDYSWLHFNESANKKKNPSSDDKKNPTSTTYTWGDENDNVYKVTVTLYKKNDSSKKNILVNLVSFKNTTNGATVSVSTDGGASPSPTASTEPTSVPIGSLPSDSSANVTFDFKDGNVVNINNSTTTLFNGLTPSAGGSMSFNNGTAFSFDFKDVYSQQDVKNNFTFDYFKNTSQISQLVWVMKGNKTDVDFNISLSGESSTGNETVFVIYNYAGLNIKLTSNSSKNWLKYGGVVVVDASGNATVLK